jgi:triosephosphate isomerase
MKKVVLNLKRFDVEKEFGGINVLAPIEQWATTIIETLDSCMTPYVDQAEVTIFFPEAHLLPAKQAIGAAQNKIRLGCQGVYRKNISPGGNFGAYTTNLPAAAAKNLGCDSVIIGHCEERADLIGVLEMAGVTDFASVNRILNQEILAAQESGLSVLYCVGEALTDRENWKHVISEQLKAGLKDVDRDNLTLAYEPIWAIGPGKMPPSATEISEIAAFVKEITDGLPLIYGGGLKLDNAPQLASLSDIDGGLIALTRFSGEIGFYPTEFCEIIDAYTKEVATK